MSHRENSDTPPADRSRPGILVSVVVPCFNEAEVLPLLAARLEKAAQSWSTHVEVIAVDDGSRDLTWGVLCQLRERNPSWRLLRLARNFGHQTAIRAGLEYASGDAVTILDADLQDPPELLAKFLDRWRAGSDVIYGVRRRRREGWLKRTTYYLFYRLISRLAEVDLPLDAGDFCLMDRKVVDLLLAMPERSPFIRGLRSWVGFPQEAIEYDREARAAGTAKYTWRKLWALALDGILSSSVVPLRLATWLGACVSSVAFLGVLLILAIKLFEDFFARWGIHSAAGIPTVAVLVLFIGGVQLLCMGIFGEYLGRIYENVKGRPHWTLRESRGLTQRAP